MRVPTLCKASMGFSDTDMPSIVTEPEVGLIMFVRVLRSVVFPAPFGLDPRGMKEVRDLIINLKKERDIIILMSTHLISEAKEVSDRVIIVDRGKKI